MQQMAPEGTAEGTERRDIDCRTHQAIHEVGKAAVGVGRMQALVGVVMAAQHCMCAPGLKGPLHPRGWAMRAAGVGRVVAHDHLPRC